MARVIAAFMGLIVATSLLACNRAPDTDETPPVQPAPIAPNAAPTPVSTPAAGALQASPTSAPEPPQSQQQAGDTKLEIAGGLARYRVNEQLARRELPNDAVGETSGIAGSIVFDADGVILSATSQLSIDLRTLKSDETRRDNYIRDRTIQTARFPTADFTPRSTEGLLWPLQIEGQTTFKLLGDMTMHGVTTAVAFDVTASFSGDQITAKAGTTITFEQFGMSKPRLFLIVSVADEIKLELEIQATVSTQS
ncbi:MAG: YceI family protein [SAR202 cluster bacterium]|nr:YceI family protein [SAR202 cluster bacterium]MDP6301030.1 YceI family protein [SAR202 cluster bacterium]MDP7104512.1 YceI family protein [SAR202 cluster bacterium]MDP7226845.1 YceI family protein [SAR202 cluster bacterium]MDP7413850.1 YceI family protein [SAR202 cluster bacterium]